MSTKALWQDGKNVGFGITEVFIQIQHLPLTHEVILDAFFYLSES